MTSISPKAGDESHRLDRVARRAARQAANQAAREERRLARQAERRSRTAPFNILIVAQAGRIARQAVLFAASLRRSAPGFRGRLIVAEPREEAAWAGAEVALDDATRALLTALGAEVLPFTARHFGRSYPYGNKIEALALLPPAEPFAFFDSDTLVTGPLERLADFSRPRASMRRGGTWPQPPLYGPDYAGIWRSLYDRFGLDFESSLDPSQYDDHWERYLYFNAGWFLGPEPQEFGRRFLDWAIAVRDDPGEALACQSLDPWLDQIVLPLVVHSLGGGRPGPALAGLDGALTCHYRDLSLLYAREPEPALDLLESLLQDRDIATLFAEDPAVQRLVLAGEGRSVVRPLFGPEAASLPEQPIRQRLKRAGLWFR